jgi:hypothetical protein
VHSRYERRFEDVALAGEPVEIRLGARRFLYDVTTCPTPAFAEQISGLTSKHARPSVALRRSLGNGGSSTMRRAVPVRSGSGQAVRAGVDAAAAGNDLSR